MAEHKFLCALKGRDIDLAKKMLQVGVLSKDKPAPGSTALLVAIRLGNLEMLDLLLDREEVQVDNPIPELEATPLQIAVDNDMAKIAARLIDAGADFEATTSRYPSPPLLMAAATNYTDEIVRLLHTRGANINAVDKGQKMKLIHAAASNKNCVAILKYVVEELKVPVDELDENGDTALLHVAAHGSLRAFKYLEEKGANLRAKDKHGFTAIFRAAQNDNPMIAAYLIGDKGWDPTETVMGSTCVEMAGTEATEEAIKNAIRAKQAGVSLQIQEPPEPAQKRYQEFEKISDMPEVDVSTLTEAERAFYASDAYHKMQLLQKQAAAAAAAAAANPTVTTKQTSFGWVKAASHDGESAGGVAVETKGRKGDKDKKDCIVM
eukprot:comp22897_c0_seq1/m.36199 comp22897_c0_seq1/g.36199  ORF comp22897_c0_seq1/g.36199 comp22897_c0_seq1/m.36199 type:complete len:378 (-) comp22897_c0_seq1:238-1371(-)